MKIPDSQFLFHFQLLKRHDKNMLYPILNQKIYLVH